MINMKKLTSGHKLYCFVTNNNNNDRDNNQELNQLKRRVLNNPATDSVQDNKTPRDSGSQHQKFIFSPFSIKHSISQRYIRGRIINPLQSTQYHLTNIRQTIKVIDLFSSNSISVIVVILLSVSALLASSQNHRSPDNDHQDRVVTNLVVYPGFRAVKLRWRYGYPNQAPATATVTTSHEPSSFKVRFCEIASWNVEIKCRERLLELEDPVSPVSVTQNTSTDSHSSISNNNNHNYQKQPSSTITKQHPIEVVSRSTKGPYLITNSDFVVHHRGSSNDYEAEIFDLRALTNYTFHVQVDRFKHEQPSTARLSSLMPTGRKLSSHHDNNSSNNNNIAPFSSMSRVQVETKGFSAEASKCLANLSEVIVNTGRYFGGRISVEDSNDPRCNVYGNKSSQQASYKLTIMHDVCGSKIVNNTKIETMILVHENKDILTHNSGRFLVVCNFVQKSFTLRASVSLPKVNGVVTRTRPATIVATTGYRNGVSPMDGGVAVSLGTMPGRFKHRQLSAAASSAAATGLSSSSLASDAELTSADNLMGWSRQAKEFKNNTTNSRQIIQDNSLQSTDFNPDSTSAGHLDEDIYNDSPTRINHLDRIRSTQDRLLIGVPAESKPIYVLSQNTMPKIIEVTQSVPNFSSATSSTPIVFSNNHNNSSSSSNINGNRNDRQIMLSKSDTTQQQQQQQLDQTMVLANHHLKPILSNEMFSNSPALAYYPSILIRHGLTTPASPLMHSPASSPHLLPVLSSLPPPSSPPQLVVSSAPNVASETSSLGHHNRTRTMRLLNHHHQVHDDSIINNHISPPEFILDRQDEPYRSSPPPSPPSSLSSLTGNDGHDHPLSLYDNLMMPNQNNRGHHHHHLSTSWPEQQHDEKIPFRQRSGPWSFVGPPITGDSIVRALTASKPVDDTSLDNINNKDEEKKEIEVEVATSTPTTLTITTTPPPSSSAPDYNLNKMNNNVSSVHDSLLRWSLSTLASIAEESFTKMINNRNKEAKQRMLAESGQSSTTKSIPPSTTISTLAPKTITATSATGATNKDDESSISSLNNTRMAVNITQLEQHHQQQQQLKETKPAPNQHHPSPLSNHNLRAAPSSAPADTSKGHMNRPISMASTMPTEASQAKDLHPTAPIKQSKHQQHTNSALSDNLPVGANNNNTKGSHQHFSNDYNQFKSSTVFDLSPLGDYLLYSVVIVVAGLIGCVSASLWFLSGPHNSLTKRGNQFNRWSHNHDAFSIITASDYVDYNPISQSPPSGPTTLVNQLKPSYYNSLNGSISGIHQQQYPSSFQLSSKQQQQQQQQSPRSTLNEDKEQMRQLETINCNNPTQILQVVPPPPPSSYSSSTKERTINSPRSLQTNSKQQTYSNQSEEIHTMTKCDPLLLVNQANNFFGAESYA